MAEQSPNNFEQEISEISKSIEARRNQLEQERGIFEEKDVAREVIGEHIKQILPSSATRKTRMFPKQPPVPDGVSYLDVLDEESERKVNALVRQMREKGIKKAVAEAQENDFYILNAFHDVLVDKLYDELKKQGYI